MTETHSPRASQRIANVRTALMLAVLASVFFGAIIVAQCFGPSAIWLGTFGVAIVGLPSAVLVGRGRAR